MHSASIIPHQNISALPCMMVVEARMVNMGEESVEKSIALLFAQLLNAVYSVEVKV